MKVVVTGGAGFIGSAVVRQLKARGHHVYVFDNLSSGIRSNVSSETPFQYGDIRNCDDLVTALKGAEIVVHLAAFVSVAQSFVEPKLCWDANVIGTRNVLEAAWRHGCKRVILASSAAVYGNDGSPPIREDSQISPMSPYAYSKWQNEIDAAYFKRYLSIDTVCLRFFNVFGPLQRADSPYSGVISIAAQKIINRDVFTVYGSGEQTRDFIYVDDVAGAVCAAAVASTVSAEVVNVGRGESTSVNEILGLIGDLTKVQPKLIHSNPRKGDIMHSVADTQRMRKTLAFDPAIQIRDGLDKTLEWVKTTLT